MLDIEFIRNNLDLCKQAAKNKNREVHWDRLLALDEERRLLIRQSEDLRAERNKRAELSSPNLPANLKTGGETIREQGKLIKQKLKEVEDRLKITEREFNDLMLTVPNVPHESVPVGKDSKDNVEIKKWGTPPEFSFPVIDHIELAKNLDLIDFERGAKVGGSRAYFLKNEAAQLEFAVLFYTFRKLIAKGYTPMIAPSLVKEFTLFGVGQFPWGRDEVYYLEKDDQYLAGTAEQTVTAYHADEVLGEKDLPKKFVAFSPCFRREAGSYGKDTRGVYRLHQFNKIEQVIIGENNLESSFAYHEELLKNAEELLQDLKLPYRVLLMCTGDMGEPQVKKYDIETWMPGRGEYGETMSNSVMGDFQARRLKIRYRTKEGNMAFCHTLNNTAVASPRILVAILENYQQADGSVSIPEVLIPLVGKEVIRPKKS